jgi:hypothetical protein
VRVQAHEPGDRLGGGLRSTSGFAAGGLGQAG